MPPGTATWTPCSRSQPRRAASMCWMDVEPVLRGPTCTTRRLAAIARRVGRAAAGHPGDQVHRDHADVEAVAEPARDHRAFVRGFGPQGESQTDAGVCVRAGYCEPRESASLSVPTGT